MLIAKSSLVDLFFKQWWYKTWMRLVWWGIWIWLGYNTSSSYVYRLRRQNDPRTWKIGLALIKLAPWVGRPLFTRHVVFEYRFKSDFLFVFLCREVRPTRPGWVRPKSRSHATARYLPLPWRPARPAVAVLGVVVEGVEVRRHRRVRTLPPPPSRWGSRDVRRQERRVADTARKPRRWLTPEPSRSVASSSFSSFPLILLSACCCRISNLWFGALFICVIYLLTWLVSYFIYLLTN